MTFEGQRIGAPLNRIGELVFTTGVVGYLETLTDPSYYGQIVTHSFPTIGNYGVIEDDFEGEPAGSLSMMMVYSLHTRIWALLARFFRLRYCPVFRRVLWGLIEYLTLRPLNTVHYISLLLCPMIPHSA